MSTTCQPFLWAIRHSQCSSFIKHVASVYCIGCSISAQFIHPISCRVISMTHESTLVYLHLHLKSGIPLCVCRWRPSVYLPAVCFRLEQLCASQWGSAAVPGPGGHLPGAALSQPRLRGPLLRQRGKWSRHTGIRVTSDHSLRTCTSSCEWTHVFMLILNAGVPLIELHVCVLMHSSCLLNSMNSLLQISAVLSRGGKDRWLRRSSQDVCLAKNWWCNTTISVCCIWTNVCISVLFSWSTSWFSVWNTKPKKGQRRGEETKSTSFAPLT